MSHGKPTPLTDRAAAVSGLNMPVSEQDSALDLSKASV